MWTEELADNPLETDDPVRQPPEEVPLQDTRPGKRFRFPAEYYSSASEPHGERSLPAWAPIGCGVAGVVVLVLIFIMGAVVREVGVGRLVDLSLGSVAGELEKLPSSAPEDERRKMVEEFRALRKKIVSEEVSITDLQPLLEYLREAVADKRLSPIEVAEVTRRSQELVKSSRKGPGQQKPAVKEGDRSGKP